MAAPLYLLRHGESEWNVRRLTQGQTAHPRLTDRGRGQIRYAAELIRADLALEGGSGQGWGPSQGPGLGKGQRRDRGLSRGRGLAQERGPSQDRGLAQERGPSQDRSLAQDRGLCPGQGSAPPVIVSSDLLRAVESAEIVRSVLGGSLALDPRLREQHLGSLQGRGYEETWAAAAEHDWSDPDLPVFGGESVREVHDRMAAVLDEVDPTRITVLVSHGDAIRLAVAHLTGVAPHEAEWVEVPNGAVARVSAGEVRWLPSPQTRRPA